ncbi:MAG: hypothetical protein HYZ57_02585 [Acidobacteria bacterium]|nr:hypothetical protein [Acidobacteriota bacterium]
MKVSRIVLALAVAGTALAQNNNPCPGEKEYQVNIIGVPKSKNPDMTNTSGHRIFVPLTGQTNIYMTGDTDSATAGLQCGNSFQVTDANGTDGSATLVVPCTNVNVDSTSTGICFDVWATPLGTPGGKAQVDVVCTFDSTVVGDLVEGSCENVPLGSFDFELVRNAGKPVQKDITNFMRASGCFDTDLSGTCDPGEKTFNNVWIFNLEALQSYFWEYDNQGLRVSMIRFCEGTDCGSFGVVPGA